MQIKNILLTVSLLLFGYIAKAQIEGKVQLDTLQNNDEVRFILQSKYQELYLVGDDLAWVGAVNAKPVALRGLGIYFSKAGMKGGVPMGDINEDYIPIKYPKGQYFDEKGYRIPANQQLRKNWKIIPSGDGEWVYLRSYWRRYLTVGGIDKTEKFAIHKQWTLMNGEMKNRQKWRLIRVN